MVKQIKFEGTMGELEIKKTVCRDNHGKIFGTNSSFHVKNIWYISNNHTSFYYCDEKKTW